MPITWAVVTFWTTKVFADVCWMFSWHWCTWAALLPKSKCPQVLRVKKRKKGKKKKKPGSCGCSAKPSGMAWDMFSHRETFKRFSFSLPPPPPMSPVSLRLSCGYFSSAQCILGKYLGIQEEEMFTIPPKRAKSKVSNYTCFSLSVSIFKYNFPSVDSWLSSFHRSPHHVRHPPTMNWWVRACLVCVPKCAKLLLDLTDLFWESKHPDNLVSFPGIVAVPHTEGKALLGLACL